MPAPGVAEQTHSPLDKVRNSRLYPREIKANSTILPGHTDGIARWSKLTGDLKAGGILVADVVDLFSIRGYRGAYPGKI